MNEFAEEPRRAARRRTGRIVGAALVGAALVGGVGFTAVRVAGADRDPGKPVWKLPTAAENNRQDGGRSKDVSGLRGLLVPYDTGVSGIGQGPDIAEFGSDATLDGREATALRKQQLGDLSPQSRQKLDKVIDDEHIQGMAMRSYAPFDHGEGVEDPFVVSVELVRMGNRASARELSRAQNEFFDALHIFPEGPRIKGHENAACFLTPKWEKDDGGKKAEEIQRMVCSASVGDVLVTVDASGPRPLGTHTLVGFIGKQLDRIKDPGEAV